MDLIFLIIFLVVTFATGSFFEKRHFSRLNKREETLIDNPFFTDSFTALHEDVKRTEFVSAGCVIAADYFKNFLGGLRNFFGGNMSAYESLTERARREAIVQMREKAGDADMVVKARIQLTELGKGRVEAIAYGTAVYLNKPSAP